MEMTAQLEFNFVKPKLTEVKEMLTEADAVALIPLLQQLADENEYENEELHEDVWLQNARIILSDAERRYMNVFIAWYEGTPIGFLVGATSPLFYRRGIVAEQKLWYVTPTRRGSYAAIKLMKSFERWGRLNGATSFHTGTINTQMAERTSKLLTTLGFEQVGTLHVKEA